MQLSALLEALGLPRMSVDPAIQDVTRDSRLAGPASAFVAIAGGRTDGHDHVGSSGAAVAFVERLVDAAVPQIVVPDTKRVLASIAAELEGHPARVVPVVGVTGTNGKTSITTLAAQTLDRLGWTTGRIGTTGNSIAGVDIPTTFTTPEAPDLQRLLARMRAASVQAALIEVSSHGLAQHRVDGIPFHLGVFTNLTQDHLDFHGTMERYAAAKAMLFQQLRPAGGMPRALLCSDDPRWTWMHAPEDRWTYGADGDLRIRQLQISTRGMRFAVDTPLGSVTIDSAMVGGHNAQNLTATLGIGLCLGVELELFAEALGHATGAPGRLERVPGDGPLVLVDYAHSPEALATVLPTIAELADGDCWVVFGAGGDRDQTKRPLMGAAAERFADRVVLTSDNPRSEDPEIILDHIQAGMTAPPAARFTDREQAIRYAILNAGPTDVVVVAGKGHETTQDIKGVKTPFDDRVVARRALEDR